MKPVVEVTTVVVAVLSGWYASTYSIGGSEAVTRDRTSSCSGGIREESFSRSSGSKNGKPRAGKLEPPHLVLKTAGHGSGTSKKWRQQQNGEVQKSTVEVEEGDRGSSCGSGDDITGSAVVGAGPVGSGSGSSRNGRQ